MTAPWWQLVLYGRTARADRWWRVRPRAADLDWLNEVVTTTTAGGEGLDAGPRFVLARRRGQIVVGGVSRAALLSDTMNSDGSRPFYTFVGWFSEDHNAWIPDLEAMEASWPTWASEEYLGWMPLDWNRHQSDLNKAHEPPRRRPPWGSDDGPGAGHVEPGIGQGPTQVLDDNAVDITSEGRFVQWRHAAAISGDVILVVGPPTVMAGAAEVTPEELPPEPSRGDLPQHPGYSQTEVGSPEVATGPSSHTEQQWAGPPVTGSAPPGSAWSAPALPPPPTTAPAPTRNRLQRKLKQLITGSDQEDHPAAPPAGAGTPMASDLEYWRRQEERKGSQQLAPKRPVDPPDTGAR